MRPQSPEATLRTLRGQATVHTTPCDHGELQWLQWTCPEPDGPPLVRALVSNDDIGSVRALSEQAIVALPQGGPPINAQPELVVPQASAKLPSAALGEAAGGSIALDLTDKTGLTAREPRFRVDLRLPADVRAPIGARVLVTFDHGEASLVDLISAALRRGFLRHFDA